ncbi:hypothetical protein EDB92DRAFT_1957157 [Lactarius akahatsu]|uniref:Secreted protein n=1 Tax=Lactarius akahatsu TaxID=416441 RepID=A0AAD4L2Y4_9AGAM|nr:hypothetical protein EDB92DRAFT_1957157 [Lactarius akahatsu]
MPYWHVILLSLLTDATVHDTLLLTNEVITSLDDTQLALSLQTADDVDLEMDADLQECVEAPNEGVETDNSGDDGDESDFFS